MGAAPGFRVHAVTLAPGEERRYDEQEWRDALVIVCAGRVEMEGLTGSRGTFAAGAILCLAGLPLRAPRNPRPGRAALPTISRR